MSRLLRKQFSVLLFLSVIACPVLWSQTQVARGFSLGIDSIHTTEDTCLMLGARAVADDFFNDLVASKGGERRTFKRHGKVVKFFPSQLTVKIQAAVAPCTGKSTLACDRCEFRFDDEFMKSVQIDAFWKRGFDQQKAEIKNLSEIESHDMPAKLWDYEFSVDSKDVLLTESLLVVLHAPDGRIVSRLSGDARNLLSGGF